MSSNTPNMPSLPRHREYYDAAHMLDEFFKSNGGVEAYVRHYSETEVRRSLSFRTFLGQMKQFGIIMEPFDRTTGMSFDSDHETVEAVAQGGVLGSLLINKAHKNLPPVRSTIRDVLGVVEIKQIDTSKHEDLEAKDRLATRLRQIGWSGVRLIGQQAEEITEGWEDAVARTRDPQMVRVGLGIVVTHADAVQQNVINQIQEDELARFAAELDQGYSEEFLDSELSKFFLGSDGPSDPSH